MSQSKSIPSSKYSFNACINGADNKSNQASLTVVPLPIDPQMRQQALDENVPKGIANTSGLLLTPNCLACHDCMELRVAVKDYPVSNKTRDLMRRNQDLILDVSPAIPDYDSYHLYKQYYADRFPDSDENKWGPEDFGLFIRQHDIMMSIRDADDMLRAVILCNRVKNGIIGNFVFYDTDEDFMKRSPGRYAFMRLFAYTAENGLDYTYIGTWNRHSPHYAYKADFKNLETYAGLKRGWVAFDPEKHQQGPSAAQRPFLVKMTP